MEFCSKYGYNYGFEGSDSESMSDEDDYLINNMAQTRVKQKRKIRKADTNIIGVKFDELVLPNHMFAGDPIKCKNCEAIMSIFSKTNIKTDDNKIIWLCEFCFEVNDLTKILKNLDEIPNNDDVTFLLEPVPVKSDTPVTSKSDIISKSSDDNYFTFCIDVSGSMDQEIHNEKESIYQQKYISRLEGVKVAAIENLSKLKEEEPNKRVSLITFSNTIKFFGDGSRLRNNEPILNIGEISNYRFSPYKAVLRKRKDAREDEEISSDILDNKEKLIALAKNQDGNLKSIKETYNKLEHKIKNLCTEGGTALGPALVFSIAFSSKKAGSQIILCTDGCANFGMGSVENSNKTISDKFYEDLADYAKENGVTVNVISMEGTDCKLSLLGKVAERSNGSLSIVNPLNLSEHFKSIIENRIVATNVKAKLYVNHKYLYIKDEKFESQENEAFEKSDQKAIEILNKYRKSVLVKDIGNANVDTEITFEYAVRRLKGEKKENAFKELPFQLQISYTTIDGAKAVRVYTKMQEFTTDRQKAEKNIKSKDLILMNTVQQASKCIMSSDSTSARKRHCAVDYFRNRNMLSFNSIEYKKNADLAQQIYFQSRSSTSAESDIVNNLTDKDAAAMYIGSHISMKQFKK